MTILDHRILIPKSPEKIWEFLSDLSQNAAWQVDCTAVSILTSKRIGSGVRWRYTTTGGRSFVVETTAWYDGLGYEYTFVDGAPFKESKGRIRLQEIAEGTVVQWTLTYETTGMLAGVRNAVGLKRQFESAMIDSLKNLWKVIQKVMPDDRPREIKSLMRDAPDYESRTQYRSRHVPLKSDEQEQASPASFNPSFIVEPPISADDTRPRAPVRVEESPADEGVIEPQAAAQVSEFAPPQLSSDVTSNESIIPVSEDVPEFANYTPQLNDEPDVVLPPPESLTASRTITQEMATVTAEASIVPSRVETVETEKSQTYDHTPAAPDTVKMETGEMSVFDLFGIPRPSQTQEINRVVIPEVVEQILSAPTSPAPDAVQSSRIGLRLVLRRKHIKIRRPV